VMFCGLAHDDEVILAIDAAAHAAAQRAATVVARRR